MEDFPTELILFLIAAIIAGVSRIVEGARAVRRRTVEAQRKQEERTGIDLGELDREPKEPPRQPEPEPLNLPLPTYGVPLPFPPQPAPEPEAEREPRPRLVLRGPEASEPAAPARLIHPALRPSKQVQAPRARRHPLAHTLREGGRAVREAIVIREILGPPRAIRPWRGFRDRT